MPHIGIVSGPLSNDTKCRLIERLTAEAADIMEVPAEFVQVTVTEVPEANYGIGGKTIEETKEQYRRKEGRQKEGPQGETWASGAYGSTEVQASWSVRDGI